MNANVFYDSGYGNDWDLPYYGGDTSNIDPFSTGSDWMDEINVDTFRDKIAPDISRHRKPPTPEKPKTIEKRPSSSYSNLVALALMHSDSGQLHVSDIYTYICEHFPYFRTAAPAWKNSVRHNLSLNKNFQKIEVGNPEALGRKSCMWTIREDKWDKVQNELIKWRAKEAAQEAALGIMKAEEDRKITKSLVKPSYVHIPKAQIENRAINPADISLNASPLQASQDAVNIRRPTILVRKRSIGSVRFAPSHMANWKSSNGSCVQRSPLKSRDSDENMSNSFSSNGHGRPDRPLITRQPSRLLTVRSITSSDGWPSIRPRPPSTLESSPRDPSHLSSTSLSRPRVSPNLAALTDQNQLLRPNLSVRRQVDQADEREARGEGATPLQNLCLSQLNMLSPDQTRQSNATNHSSNRDENASVSSPSDISLKSSPIW